MVIIKESREYDIDAEKMWSIVSDFSNIHKVHPLVKSVDQLSAEPRGNGAKRRCNFYDGGNAVEETRNWNEDRMSYNIELVDGSLPMKSVIANVKVDDLGSGRSRASMEVDLKPKFGVIGAILAQLVMKPKFGKVLQKLLAGFGYHAKTGKEVNDKHSISDLVNPL